MSVDIYSHWEPAKHGQVRPGRSSLLDRIADRLILLQKVWEQEGPERPILTVLLKKRRTLRSFRINGGKKDLATHMIWRHFETRRLLIWVFSSMNCPKILWPGFEMSSF